MTEKQRFKILNEFANDLSIVKGGRIKVGINDNTTSYTPEEGGGMRYEDCNLLNDILMGAKQLLFYLSRNNYEIKRRKND